MKCYHCHHNQQPAQICVCELERRLRGESQLWCPVCQQWIWREYWPRCGQPAEHIRHHPTCIREKGHIGPHCSDSPGWHSWKDGQYKHKAKATRAIMPLDNETNKTTRQ